MNRVHVLDCTLRDGGYCNEWKFGIKNIKKIINGLIEANIDVIECGFLTNKIVYNPNMTKFNNVNQLCGIIPLECGGKSFVVMMNYGEYTVENIPQYDGTCIDGIRVAFHKENIEQALELCSQIKEKGYKVYIQPMISLRYTDEEFLKMIRRVNEIEPYAFYIVDSFGTMKKKDLLRLFYMSEYNLKNSISIGFHSHNNMQSAFSNAQVLVNVCNNRNLIVDSSVYGMGRGAGNLNTELFIDYLNLGYEQYQLPPLLNIIDEVLDKFYRCNYWGYSLPNYISAVHNAHPNYAQYLDQKKTLTVKEMNEIFDMMDEDTKYSFDKEYIEKLYIKYMTKHVEEEQHQGKMSLAFKGKTVLLIAPGKSSAEQNELICKCAEKEDTVVVSVNFEYPYKDSDYIFVSNLRRFKELDLSKRKKCIVTSNISADNVWMRTEYGKLVLPIEAVKDNAGMMAIRFLLDCGVKEVLLAGFDGYSHETEENYVNGTMAFVTRNEVLDSMNVGMTVALKEYSKSAKIRFITEPKYLKI